MRKINSVLGIYPTRVSRVNAINSADQSLESVVFQQGKSLLDYDLNVMQDIASKNIQRLAQSLYKTSGFLTSIGIPTSSIITSYVNLNSCYVSILGHIFQVASTGTGSPNLSVNLPSNTRSFMWIEAWYQEIVPTSAAGETIGSVATQTKDAKLYKYGNAGSPVSNIGLSENTIADNTILDPVFAAETTRRIQLRWRIRIDALDASTNGSSATSVGFYSSSTTPTASGVPDNDAVSNVLIKAYGGRTADYLSSSPYTFWRADNYAASATSYGSLSEINTAGTYKRDMRDSFSEFISYKDNALYIAGRGTDDDAQTLNTVDGRVYGIPIAIISYAGSTSTFASKTNEVATSSAGNLVVGANGALNVTITAIDPNFSNNSSIKLTGGAAKTDLYLSTLDVGSSLSYVVPTRLSVSQPGTATNPSISFELTSRNSGFYTSSSGTTTNVGVSVATKEIANFYNNTSDSSAFGLNVAGLLNVTGATTFTGNVTSTGGIFTANSTSLTNIFPRLTSNTLFSSSNVLVTGGSISTTSVLLKAGSTPIASGDIQWDNSTTTLKVGSSNTSTVSFGYLGSTVSTAVSGSVAQTALAGTSNEVARADHRHANPSTYSPSSHVSQHVLGGSDPFGPITVNGVSTNVNLNAVAKVGVSLSTVSSGQATSTIGTIYQRRQINFIAGANTTLNLSENDTNETASLTISANVAGFQDVWTNTTTAATLMTANKYYTVVTTGTTSVPQWQAVGAPASVTVGTVFLASGGVSSGDGTVRPTFNSLPSAPGDVGSYAWIPVSYMVPTNSYVIMSIGTTNFTLLGASANTIGLTFTANTTVPTGTGMVMPITNQQYAAHREHTHPRLDGYSTTFSTLPISGTGTAGTSTDLSRGDHQHSWPLYLTAKFGFGATPTSIASALDVYGTSTYTTMASSLFVRDGAAFAADVGGRIALGGAVNGTTFTAYAGISGRKSVAAVDNYTGYLSLWVNAGSSTTLTEFFRGYDNGSIYIGTTGQTKPTDADSMVVKGKITAAGFVVTGGTGISVGSGGTGTTSYAVGDVLYADTTTTLAKLTKPTATSFLSMTSLGAPSWASLANTGITGVGTITTGAWNGTVGASTPSTGAFTTISASGLITASGGITGTIGATTASTGAFTTISASGLITASGGITGTIGATTASTGAFTTISASGLITASGGITGTIGATTASTGAFTSLQVAGQDALQVTGYQPFITLRDSNGSNKGLRIQTASSEALFALDSATAGTYVTIGKLTSNGLDILQNIFAGVASAEKTSQNGTSFGFNKYVHTTGNSINTAHGYMIIHGATSATPGSDYLQFGSYGTDGVATKANALVINGSGQIGIRTVPSADFHVTGTVAGSVAPKVFLPAQAFNLPPASYPTFFQRDTNTTKYELQYSGTADQVAHTTIVVPSNYSGGNIAIKLYWYTATANQSVSWQILAKSIGDGGDPNPVTTALGTIASTTNTAGMLKLETYSWNSSSGLNINTVSAGQILYLSLKRLGASDTSSETINFHSMIIEF